MSETMEGNNFAQNSITRAQSGFSFRDNSAGDTYHSHDRHFNVNQASNDYLSIEQQNFQLPYDVSQPTNFTYGQEYSQHPYQPLNGHVGQEAQNHGLQYYPPHPYHIPHVANPIPNYFSQDERFWDGNVRHEVDLTQQDLDNEEVVMSVPERSRPTAARNDQIYKNEPYAKLIFIALRSAPGHKMVLKDIYKWFERFTDKAQPGSKGWQNSIRHNLSMNVAFLKEETGTDASDGKRNYVWALSKEALEKGTVESTTRFRKHPKKTVAQSSHRVSKASTATVSRTIPSPRYLLPPYDQAWNKDTAKIQQKQDLEEPQALQPQNSTWPYEIPEELAHTTVQPQPYQFFPNGYFPSVQSAGDYEPDTEGAPYLFGYGGTIPFQQPLKCESGETVHPFDPAAAEEDSPTPSMTATNSSFGYHEMMDEEQHHFDHSPDLQSNVLQSGERSQFRPRMSSANPYFINYEEEGAAFASTRL